MTQSSGRARTVKATPRRRRRRITFKGVLLTLLALVLVGIGVVGLAYSMVDVPTPNDLAKAETSIVYYADGKTELDRLSEVNRESVAIAQVPKLTQQAVLAAEDRSFYENKGFSPTGIGRAVLGAVRGQDAGGGSTITQQYVKNYFLTSDQTVTRKVKELIISVKIEQEYDKDQILENYLNTIYYGRNAYGIQTAAKAYFGKDVKDLGLGESAFLAAAINQPSTYGKVTPETAKTVAGDRWNYVLDGMVEKGWITAAQRAKTAFPQVAAYAPKDIKGGTDGYLVQAVKDELLERGLKQEDLDRGGLRVVTTIDKGTQQQLVDAVENNRRGTPANLRVGAVSIKPKDGAILAMYGGPDFATQQFNAVTQGHMQAGSTFKAFGTVALLQQGKSTRTRFDSSSPLRLPGEPKPVSNWQGYGLGMLDVPQMLAQSVNTAFVRLNQDVGPENTRKAAVAAGISPAVGAAPANSPGLEDNVGNILGAAAVRPLDMANAYATIAAEGQRARPYLVVNVKDAAGNLRFEGGPELTKAFDRDVAVDTIAALRAVIEDPNGTGTGAQRVGRPAAGKTGTSDQSRSAWFAGFTPEVATAIGMELPDKAGNPQSMEDYPQLNSGALPVTVWTQFTRAYLDGKPVTQFPDRVGIGDSKLAPPPAPRQPSRPQPTTSTTTPTPTETPSVTVTETVAPQPTTQAPAPTPTVPPRPQPSVSATVPPATPAQAPSRAR